ncbi:hypothetical protein DAMA08_016600 [Martiniozyma asiatica (nom. inval.)]|nr:hypothetical protein DAMA08_016600 [Martiniozyma asiatica]
MFPLSYINSSPQQLLHSYTRELHNNIGNLTHTKNHPFINSTASTTLSLDPIYRQYLISGCPNGNLKFYDLNSPKKPLNLPIHKFGITHAEFYHDSGMILTSSHDHNLTITDASSLEQALSFDLESRVTNFSMTKSTSANPIISVTTESNAVTLLDLRIPKPIHILSLPKSTTNIVPQCTKWSPCDENLLIAAGNGVSGWDIRSSKGTLFNIDVNEKLINRQLQRPINGLIWIDPTNFLTHKNNDLNLWSLGDNYPTIPPKMSFFGNAKNLQPSVGMYLNEQVDLIWIPTDNGIQIFETNGDLLANLKGSKISSVVQIERCKYAAGSPDGIQLWGYDSTSNTLEIDNE